MKDTERLPEQATAESEKVETCEKLLRLFELDSARDGAACAILIENLTAQDPTSWKSELDEIAREALGLKTQSLKSAMFYLGDIVHATLLQHIERDGAVDAERRQKFVSLSKTLLTEMRAGWPEDRKAIAAAVDNEYVPMWWTQHEMSTEQLSVTLEDVQARLRNRS